jgi:protein-S-isoprenylcysteine O-methyltransferase Ste14
LFAGSVVLGAGSLALFAVFLFNGPFCLVPMGLEVPTALAVDAALSAVFFLQHSAMTRSGFRRRLSLRVDEKLHGAVYSSVSGITLLVVLVLWQGPTPTLVEAPGPMRWVLRGLFAWSLLGFLWSAGALGGFDGLGLRDVRSYLDGRTAGKPRFTVRGPYRWVRHPIYLFSLVLFWTYPDLTGDRLLFNVLWTGWVCVGAVLEERDLVEVFGSPYREYQRRVPMLVPYRLRPGWPASSG